MKLLLLLLLSLPSAAWAQTTLQCRSYASGWQIYSQSAQRFLGSGYFYQRSDCQNAIINRKQGYVCAAQNGGGIVADIKTGKQIGAGYFVDFFMCQQAVNTARDELICAPHFQGLITHSRQWGILSRNQWSSLSFCQASISEAQNKIVCTPFQSGFAMMNYQLGIQIATGFWNAFSDCLQAARVVENNLVCAPEVDRIATANVTTGRATRQRYPSLQRCQAHLL